MIRKDEKLDEIMRTLTKLRSDVLGWSEDRRIDLHMMQQKIETLVAEAADFEMHIGNMIAINRELGAQLAAAREAGAREFAEWLDKSGIYKCWGPDRVSEWLAATAGKKEGE